jgi:hypothetical protein
MTAHDGAAIDDTCHDRRKLAARHRHHRLIQHGEALFHSPQGQQRSALQVAGEGCEIAIGKALADDACTFRTLQRLFQLSGIDVPLSGRQQEIPLLDAVLRMQLDQTLRAGLPAARASRLATRKETEANPECSACGGEVPT